MNRKIYIVGGSGSSGYVNWILPLGFTITDNLDNSSLVFFTGGEDVNPKFYNSAIHPTTSYSDRDIKEKEIFDKAVKLGKKIWGCCRGSQAICAFQKGGYLIQHSKHPGLHEGITEDGDVLTLTSSHHQMAGLKNLNHRLLVYANNLSPYHYLGDGTDIECLKEPEITYYPDISGVGSQSHVEWQWDNNDKESKKTVKYHQEVLMRLMNNNL